jgi:hypothetical protein
MFMKIGSVLVLTALTLTMVFGILMPDMSAGPQEAAKIAKPKCLDCHGPFDKIAAATAKYQAPSGETVTPHQYIPHAEKKNIPECTECHRPHPVPLESKSDAVKPESIDFCYSGCHHARNLQRCNTCH